MLDSNNEVLYHQNRQLIGKVLPAIVSPRDEQTNGSLMLAGAGESTQLAGYAVVPTTGWTVVALKPINVTLNPLSGLLMKVLKTRCRSHC